MIRIGIGTFIESNQNFDMLDFEERGKPGEPLGAKKRTSNKLNPHNYEAKYGNRNPGNIGGGRVLSPLCHPYSKKLAREGGKQVSQHGGQMDKLLS